MKLFIQALVNALQADVQLVALVSHTSDDPGIFDSSPDMIARYPCLAVCVEESRPAVPTSNAIVKWNFVELYAVSKDRLNGLDIVRRVEQLFEQSDAQPHRMYFDISNDDICNNVTTLLRIGKSEKNEKIDAWLTVIEAKFHWHYK